jgi:hypothetical protein
MSIIQTGYDRLEELDSLPQIQQFSDENDSVQVFPHHAFPPPTLRPSFPTPKHPPFSPPFSCSPSPRPISTPIRLDFDTVASDFDVAPTNINPIASSPDFSATVDPHPTIISGGARRGSRVRTKNPKFFNDDKWINFNSSNVFKAKLRFSLLNKKFINCLQWSQPMTTINSVDYSAFLGVCALFNDYDEGTVEHQHPLVLQMKANSEDNSTWEEAMNGPEQSGYWKSMETKLTTLEEKKHS